MKYKVNMQKTEEGYSVWVPGLPGCWSQGKTEQEALENIKDAIEGTTRPWDKDTGRLIQIKPYGSLWRYIGDS